MNTEKEAQDLQQEAKLFVTRFVRVLFGAVSTTKMHRLAFHLLQELLLRGNLEEADTSTNEMLHKLLKGMYRVTNKHPATFEVQMMRCEQTLLHILTEDIEEKLKDVKPDTAADEPSATSTGRLRRRARVKGAAPSRTSRIVSEHENGYDASDESEDLGMSSGSTDLIENDACHRRSDRATGSPSVRSASSGGDESGSETCTSDESDNDDMSSDDGVKRATRGTSSDDLLLAKSGTRHNKEDAEVGSSSSGTVSGADSSKTATTSDGSVSSGSIQSETTELSTAGKTATSASVSSRGCGGNGSNSRTGGSSNELQQSTRRGKRRSSRPLQQAHAPPTKRRRAVKHPSCRGSLHLKRVRVRGERLSVALAAAADGGRLQQLPELLGLVGTQTLTVVNSMAFTASFEWGAEGFGQRVRASRSLYNGSPWWDHVLYEDGKARQTAGPTSSSKPSLGLARLLIRAIDGERCDLVVLQRLEDADARRGCVLTEFGCSRQRWRMHPTTGFPSLAVVPLSCLQRLEHVVPDFEDLCDRLGLYATPATVPDSPQEMHLQRYFVNAFFPWTGGAAKDPM